MIRFFRNIRQKLAAENKVAKYLRYAIGEILLVVIGILIALQINNWNENQKERKLENEYYCRLLEDAIQDEEQLNNLIGLAKARLKASNQAVRILLQNEVKKIEIGDKIHLSTKAIYSDFKPNNSAYEDLKSGANLNIITDKSVIKKLNQYFNKVEELKSIIMVNGKHAVDILFTHNDNFSNGLNQSSIKNGRFSTGLDQDLKDSFKIKDHDILTAQMKKRLLNEILEYVSANTRQVELYNYLIEEVSDLEFILRSKCQEKEK